MIKLNVAKLKTLIKKGTLNNSIDGLQLVFKEGRVRADMKSSLRDIVTYIDAPNDVIELTEHDDIVFNLSDPVGSLLPYLDLITEEVIDADLIQESNKDKIVFYKKNQKGYMSVATYHFCKDAVLRQIIHTRKQERDEYLLEFPVDTETLKIFDEIRKFGMRFGKVYMLVKNNMFSIGTYDRNNTHSNDLINEIEEIDHEDLEICFDYKNFISLLSIIESEMAKEDGQRYRMRFIYITNVNETPNGILQTISEDETEKYFLVNREV